MTIIGKITALLPVLRREDIEQLPPFQRQRLADLCKWIVSIAEPQEKPAPKTGVLVELRQFRRES